MNEASENEIPALSGLLEDTTFRTFYQRALPVVFGYFIKRCGGDRDVAADLTQETFASAVASLRRGLVVEAPMPWIVTVARRRLIDHYRRQRRRPFLVRDVPEVGSPIASPMEERLVRALSRLPGSYQAVLVLHHVDGLSVAEVARLVKSSVRAAESRLVRARRALSKEYEEAAND